MARTDTIRELRKTLRWLSHTPDAGELCAIWMFRVGLARTQLSQQERALLDEVDAMLDEQADALLDALDDSACPENFPLDDWTREFYRRHNRELPEGWKE